MRSIFERRAILLFNAQCVSSGLLYTEFLSYFRARVEHDNRSLKRRCSLAGLAARADIPLHYHTLAYLARTFCHYPSLSSKFESIPKGPLQTLSLKHDLLFLRNLSSVLIDPVKRSHTRLPHRQSYLRSPALAE